jgi:ribonuclease HI
VAGLGPSRAWRFVLGALRRFRRLSVYCDGSAEERVGRPGGWAFLVVRRDRVLASKSGASRSTTCLVMELEAALSGLNEVLARGWHLGHRVELVSDSSIALDVAAGRFVPKPQAALARALRQAALEAKASTRWVRGHSGSRWNEAADALADEAKRRGP